MPIQFNLQSFPSLVMLSKNDELTKECFSEGEYKILEDFAEILQTLTEDKVDPLTLINVYFDERQSVSSVYGANIAKSEITKELVVVCNKIEYPTVFKEGEGLFFGGIKIMPLLSGKEYEKENSEKVKVKIQPCAGLINNYQLNIQIDVDNPFTQNDQISLMSGFMMGNKSNFEDFLNCVSFPKSGGNRIRPNSIPAGVYLIEGYEISKDKFGEAYHLEITSLLNKEKFSTFSCSYFKEKFLIYQAASVKSDKKLYLIVDKAKEIGGNKSFNGSFSFNPQQYLDKFSKAA
jgi:hypothetical protein